MTKKRWLLCAVLVIISLSLLACQMKKDKSRPAPKRKQTQQMKQGKKTPPELPTQFTAMETTSLKLYNAGFKDWNEAQILDKQLKTDWETLKKELQKTKAPQDKQAEVEMHLSAIDQAIKSQSQFELSEHANELIGSMQELTKKFKTTTPPEVIMAQTDLREIQLHVSNGDWTILKDLSKKAQQDWKKVAPKAQKAGAKGTGQNLEGYFKELDSTIKDKDAKKAQTVVGLMNTDLANLRTALEKQGQQKGKEKSGS
jgi:thioredoxin-related protein